MIRQCFSARLLSATILMLAVAPALAGHVNIWQRVHTTIPIRDFAASPDGYAAAGANGIWISRNLTNWRQATVPAGMGLPYNSIIWGGGQFIAAGAGGIVTSPDGIVWTLAYSDPPNRSDINSLVYAGSVYLAVGSDEHGALVLRSTDGHTWTPETTGLDNTDGTFYELYGVTHGNGLYVVMGVTSTSTSVTDLIITSPDGINWTQVTLPDDGTDDFFGLSYDGAFGNGIFVEGGSYGVYTSADGINWTVEFFPQSDLWQMVRIGFINGQFIGVGADYDVYPLSYAVFTSPDGTNWSKQDLAQEQEPSIFSLSSVLQQGDTYILSGYVGVWSSPDSANWTRVFSGPQSNGYGCLGYADGNYVMLSPTGSGNLILRSTDGTNWPDMLEDVGESIGGGEQPGCIAYGDDKFVAGGFSGLPQIFYSTDGAEWTAASVPDNAYFASVAWNGSKFLSLGGFFNGTKTVAGVYSSPHGTAWTRISTSGLPPYGLGLFSLKSINGAFIAWQFSPPLYVSSNGANWTKVDFPEEFWSLTDIAYGRGRYIAVGIDADGKLVIATSTNGLDWILESGLRDNLSITYNHQIIYAGGEFLVPVFDETRQLSAYLISHDGLHWTKALQPDNGYLQTLAWDGTKLVGSSFYDIFNAPGVKLDLTGKAKVIRKNGVHLRYAFTLNNDSADDTVAHDAVFSDPLPEDTAFEDATTSQGRCNLRDNTVVCTLGDLAPAMMARVVIQISVTQSVCSISNSAKSYADEPVRDDGTPETTVTISRPHC